MPTIHKNKIVSMRTKLQKGYENANIILINLE